MTHKVSRQTSVPLCVDLDGTLIHTDVLWEGIKFLLRRKPLALLWMLPLLRGGRAPFKKAVSAKSTVSVDSLPWREALVSWLRSEAAAGRPIYLVTAADSAYAQAVCERLGFFTGALSSDGALNLKAKKKARRLIETFGQAALLYRRCTRRYSGMARGQAGNLCYRQRRFRMRAPALPQRLTSDLPENSCAPYAPLR